MTHVKICVGCPAGPPRSGFRSGGQAAPSCAFACSIRATARMISSGVRAGPQPVIGIGGRGEYPVIRRASSSGSSSQDAMNCGV